jgi:heterotetrameric sarcosine oxidase delta subunit
MNRLYCPFCGARELEEFRFHKTLAEPGANAYEEVYERINRLAVSIEHWQHVHGCRAWLLVRRNPSNDSVRDVRLLATSDAPSLKNESPHDSP